MQCICHCTIYSAVRQSRGWYNWTARRSNQSILKEIIPEYSLEGLMLKLKLQYFGHLMWRADSLEKTLMLGKIEGRRRRGRQVEMVGWHHWLNGREFEQALGGGEGQGSLAWGHKELDITEHLSKNNLWDFLNSSEFPSLKPKEHRTFLVVQLLRFHTPNAGGPGLIPGQGTRSYLLQLRPGTAK